MKSSATSSVAVIKGDDTAPTVHGIVTAVTQIVEFTLTGYTDESRTGKVI